MSWLYDLHTLGQGRGSEMSPTTLICIILFAGDVFDAETEFANFVPSVAEAELNFGVKGGAVVKHLGQIRSAVGFEVDFGGF
jgi:hypothetical protein